MGRNGSVASRVPIANRPFWAHLGSLPFLALFGGGQECSFASRVPIANRLFWGHLGRPPIFGAFWWWAGMVHLRVEFLLQTDHFGAILGDLPFLELFGGGQEWFIC